MCRVCRQHFAEAVPSTRNAVLLLSSLAAWRFFLASASPQTLSFATSSLTQHSSSSRLVPLSQRFSVVDGVSSLWLLGSKNCVPSPRRAVSSQTHGPPQITAEALDQAGRGGFQRVGRVGSVIPGGIKCELILDFAREFARLISTRTWSRFSWEMGRYVFLDLWYLSFHESFSASALLASQAGDSPGLYRVVWCLVGCSSASLTSLPPPRHR